MNGYIKLNKAIMEHWIWNEKPFTKGQAWIDLLLRARWKDGQAIHRGNLVERKRGSVYCSMAYLADQWGWDRRTVKRFLDMLEADGMVSVKCTTRDTVITIENYGKWQDPAVPYSTTECTTDGATDSTTECTQKKKEKKEKKEKTNNLLSNNLSSFNKNKETRPASERFVEMINKGRITLVGE